MRSHTGTSLSLGFTGELTDPSTGFVDLRARELDPTLGRFLSADTVQPNAPGSQGYNLYAYVANNPTTLDRSEWLFHERGCRRSGRYRRGGEHLQSAPLHVAGGGLFCLLSGVAPSWWRERCCRPLVGYWSSRG